MELLEAVFSVRPVPSLDNEEQLRLRESLEMTVRRVGVWCEMAASLGVGQWVSCETVAGQYGRERGSWGSYSVGNRYQATTGEDTAE
jgi:hypothetical protein